VSGLAADGRPERGRTVVYTAQFGGYDQVMPALTVTPGVDHLVLSDRRFRVPAPWSVRVVEIPEHVRTDRLRNRYCKLHATRLLPDYALSAYVDTQLQIVEDLSPLLDGFAASGRPVGLMPHPHSRNVDHEVERSVRTGRISTTEHAERWEEQRRRQRAAGFLDDQGVFIAWIVLRDHRSAAVVALEDAWWAELEQGVTRDQVALPFALWRTRIPVYTIPLDWSLTPYFQKWRHLADGGVRQRLVRWFDARVAVRPAYRWALRVLRPRRALAALIVRQRHRM
jgi:hypothetical protein